MMDRRKFLKLTASTGMSGFAALQGVSCAAVSHLIADESHGGYGPLERAGPDFKLPAGFQYKKFGITDSLMSDGNPTPSAHDGMAAFPMPNGNIRLIRNHEVGGRPVLAPVVPPVYDLSTGGGTVSLEIDPNTREVVRDFVSLSGTAVNCAGCATPWGSWLTCEEIVVGPMRGVGRAHGYVFEVPASAEEPVEPVPLKAMGRFVHEAAAVDPTTGIVYLTEDQWRAGFYRFLPERPYRNGEPADLTAGGELQMLAVVGQPRLDADRRQEVGRPLPVRWVTILDPDPKDAVEDIGAVFGQGWLQGGARFSRIEGCFYGDEGVYFSCTNGGALDLGQIWRYRPLSPDEGEVTLLFESPHQGVLDAPDNLCVSPRGMVLITEDGRFRNYVRALTPSGKIFDFAQNTANRSEIAGPTFSPDGQTLFLNIQRPGATYAIWGPWERGGI